MDSHADTCALPSLKIHSALPPRHVFVAAATETRKSVESSAWHLKSPRRLGKEEFGCMQERLRKTSGGVHLSREGRRKHQAQRKLDREERRKLEEELGQGAGDEDIPARFDTPPPFVSSQELFVHDLDYLKVHVKSYFDDHNPFAGRSSTGPRAPRPERLPRRSSTT
jgi:hypothetical protein